MGKTVEYADGSSVKMKKKSKENKTMTNDLMLFGDGNSHVETNDDHLKKEKRDKYSEKKRKSESKEDGDGDQHHKASLVNDDLQKSKKRNRKYSSEKAQIKDNELDQNAGSDVEKDCDPKPEKKKTDVVKGTGISIKDCPEETLKKIDEKKKKVDGQNIA
ncbi:hypothetical protein L1987_19531 [Smallanthus sonchifolius]|uniref:Uncharacterized protein n=1 Tax=Smallanthus sonchifolius TaxID=185202 RepID=A0ACB9IQY6_9ASTR|nr:hypothetical protein L1987_19531 [Smallanthus sonchifolius]